MTTVESTGNTVEEAKQKALQALGVSDPTKVVFEVLEEGVRGLLGIAVTPARVRATLISSDEAETESQPPFVVTPDLARKTADYIDHLVRKLRLQIQAVLRGFHARYVEVELVGRDANILVGRNGEVLEKLQYLVNSLVVRVVDPQIRVVLDGAGWRRRRAERLRNQVISIANEVKRRKEEAVLPPMPANERRIVHQTLRDDPEVCTYSEGEEPDRYVVISPRLE
ncbi:MAG: hypothetical protein C4336_03040 [Armatimonadota bacterium]